MRQKENNGILKIELDNLYNKFKNQYSSDDPVWFLRNFKDDLDIEVAGLISSCYAYGQIGLINRFISEFLKRVDGKPAEFILNFDLRKDVKLFNGMKYRFNSENDLINLLENIRVNLKKYGSMLNLFSVKYNGNDKYILNALRFFSDSLRIGYIKNLKAYNYLMPDVTENSACKRLNLFLRWMVRKDEIDLGIWSRKIDKSKLIMPVDVHVYRVSREMNLVSRKSCDMKFALMLTEKLKSFDASDPVKYDFALCHKDI
jgi:uncharacterized protein (TIGR02757 family)